MPWYAMLCDGGICDVIKRDIVYTKTVGGRNININMKTDNNVQNCDCRGVVLSQMG